MAFPLVTSSGTKSRVPVFLLILTMSRFLALLIALTATGYCQQAPAAKDSRSFTQLQDEVEKQRDMVEDPRNEAAKIRAENKLPDFSPDTLQDPKDAANSAYQAVEHQVSTERLRVSSVQANEWEKLAGCRLISNEWNDGDSFHVRTTDGTELIFRLYFVDTPESESSLPERLTEQAAYFGSSPETVVKTGKAAKAFTAKTLSGGPFTVWTRWRDALGRSKLPRYYAMVQVGNKDLGELLVSAGLARIYGTRVPLPDGRDSRDYLGLLEKLQAEAKSAGRGGWGK